MPDVLFVFNNYDISGYAAKAQSLASLSTATDLSVIEYIIVVYLVRLVTVLAMSVALLYISFRSRNFIIGIIIGITLFILPVGVSIILPVAKKLWITPFICETIIQDFDLANLFFTIAVFAAALLPVLLKDIRIPLIRKN